MFIIIMLIIVSAALAQPSSKALWKRTFFKGQNVSLDGFLRANDGGFVLAYQKHSQNLTPSQLFIMKVDSLGDSLWISRFGGPSYAEIGDILETEDGCIMATGYAMTQDYGNREFYYAKYDGMGRKVWEHSIARNQFAMGTVIKKTNEGGYLIAGRFAYEENADSNSQENQFREGIFLLRIDDSGDTLWTRSYEIDIDLGPKSVEMTPDQGFIITATVDYRLGRCKAFLMKINNSGDNLWTHSYGGENKDFVVCAVPEPGGEYSMFISVSEYIIHSYNQLLRLDKTGQVLWSKRVPGLCNCNPSMLTAKKTKRGYLIAGSIFKKKSRGKDFYLSALDTKGNEVWSVSYGGKADEYCQFVEETSDGGYIMAGMTGKADCGLFMSNGIQLIKTRPARNK